MLVLETQLVADAVAVHQSLILLRLVGELRRLQVQLLGQRRIKFDLWTPRNWIWWLFQESLFPQMGTGWAMGAAFMIDFYPELSQRRFSLLWPLSCK